MPNKGKGYTGELANSIQIKAFPKPPLTPFGSEEEYKKKREVHAKESLLHMVEKTQLKMALLFGYFNIDTTKPDAWQNLAYALARKHVDGFALTVEGSGSGRKKGFDLFDNARSYFEFEAKKEELKEKEAQKSSQWLRKRITDDLVKRKLAIKKADYNRYLAFKKRYGGNKKALDGLKIMVEAGATTKKHPKNK